MRLAHIFPRVTKERQAFGSLGERIAERWLVGRGWAILDRRFRSGHRDIDLVATRNGVVAFVEVKTRQSDELGDPIEAVSWRKQRQLARSAQAWIDQKGAIGEAYRFDVIGVLIEGKRTRIRHVENAFEVP